MTTKATSRAPSGSLRRTLILVAAALTLATLTAASKGEDPTWDHDDREVGEFRSRGYSSFQQNCVFCHGPTGQGNGSAAKFLKKQPKNLTLIANANGGEFSFDEVYRIIDGRKEAPGHGLREMPVWGEVLEQGPDWEDRETAITRKIQELVYYLSSIQVSGEK